MRKQPVACISKLGNKKVPLLNDFIGRVSMFAAGRVGLAQMRDNFNIKCVLTIMGAVTNMLIRVGTIYRTGQTARTPHVGQAKFHHVVGSYKKTIGRYEKSRAEAYLLSIAVFPGILGDDFKSFSANVRPCEANSLANQFIRASDEPGKGRTRIKQNG